MTAGTGKALWQKLEADRRPYLEDAQDCASLTIPSMYPPNEDLSSHRDLPTPFQSVGARGVRTLASKFVLALLPPNNPFFQFTVDAFSDGDEIDQTALEQLDADLLSIELAIHAEISQIGLRPAMYDLWKHLLVGGNGLLQVPDEGNARFWGLGSFMQRRDASGTLQVLVTKETKVLETLPKEVQFQLRHSGRQQPSDGMVDLFTVVQLVSPGTYKGWQEVEDILMPGTAGTWRGDELPYISVGMGPYGGRSYAHSFCTEQIGDLRTLEGLSESITVAAAVAAHKIYLVDPNGATRIGDIQGRPTGSVVPGREQDIGTLEHGSGNDLQAAVNLWGQIKNSLEQDFLSNQSVQRNAERVTAEEIRTLVGELDEAFGGIFSVFSETLQEPLVKRVMARMRKAGKIPEIPEQIRVKIVTGLEGLGRTQEISRIRNATRDLQDAVGPEAAAAIIRTGPLATRIFTGHGVAADDIIKSAEEQAQEAQAAQAAQLTESLGPDVIRAQSQQQ